MLESILILNVPTLVIVLMRGMSYDLLFEMCKRVLDTPGL